MSQWFHGSPLRLDVLRAGSTITRDREVARVFSHKPTLVARDDLGRITHNGTQSGYLYEVRSVMDEDVYPHPETTMDEGVEWLTRRDLPLILLEETVARGSEGLSKAEQEQLWRQRDS